MSGKIDFRALGMPGIKQYKDRHRRWRYYLRTTTPPLALPDFAKDPVKFRRTYDEAVSAIEAVADNVVPNSIGALIVAFKRSAGYPEDVKSAHYVKWTRLLDRIQRKHGDKMAATLKTATVKEWHLKMAKISPSVADEMLWVGRTMYQWAKEADKFDIKDNPFAGIGRARSKRKGTKGKHHPWTRDEIDRWRAHWPEGTPERLMLELALLTGFRAQDLIAVGRWCVRPGRPEDGEKFAFYWDFTQNKGRKKYPQQQGCPLHPDLVALLKAHADVYHWDAVGVRATFLRSERKRPWTIGGFNDWFRRARKAVGLTGGNLEGTGKRNPKSCSPHGLRHSAGHALARKRCTAVEIATFLGHANIGHVQDYIDGWERAEAGERVMKKLAREPRVGIVRKLITRRAV